MVAGITIGDGIWQSLEGSIANGATDAIANGGAAAGSAVLQEGFALTAANAGSIAGTVGVSMLTNTVLPGIAAAGVVGQVLARNNINHVWNLVTGAATNASRFANCAAAAMDDHGRLDISKMKIEKLSDEELQAMGKSRMQLREEFMAEMGEKRLERPSMYQSFMSRVEPLTCSVKRFFGVPKDVARSQMTNSIALENMRIRNNQTIEQNKAAKTKNFNKLVKAIGNAGVDGAIHSLVDFAKSEEFVSLSGHVFDMAMSQKAGQAVNYLAKAGAKGAVEGVLQAAEENQSQIKKAVGNVGAGAADGVLESIGQEKNQETLGATTKNVANSGVQGVIEGLIDALGVPDTPSDKPTTGEEPKPTSKADKVRQALTHIVHSLSHGAIPPVVAGALTLGILHYGSEFLSNPSSYNLRKTLSYGILSRTLTVPWMKSIEDKAKPLMKELYDWVVNPAHVILPGPGWPAFGAIGNFISNKWTAPKSTAEGGAATA